MPNLRFSSLIAAVCCIALSLPALVMAAGAAPLPSASAAGSASSAAPLPPAASASAASPGDTDRRDQARGHFEKGVTLIEEEAWDAALAEFQRSRELHPTRAATKNAALCLRKLHRFDEALDLFEELFRQFPNMPADDRKMAENALRDLASLVGRIEIQGGEAGAKIVVDGRERGQIPAAAIRVNAGTHFVRVSKEGFLPFETQTQVPGGQSSRIAVKLAAIAQGGRLRVSEQSGSTVNVIVDNVVVGKTPWEGVLPIGDHTIMLRGEGSLGTQPALAPVKLNQVTPLTMAVEPLDATLRVEPVPAGALVAIDGVPVGRGLWEGHLRVGAHRVEVGSDGFLPQTRQVSIEKDKRATLSIALERDPSSAIWRSAHPARIVVELDAAMAVAPTLGGDIAGNCSGACSKGPGLGVWVQAHAGYQFSSGLGVWLEGGYLQLGQTVDKRSMQLYPRGLDPNAGVAKDSLTLSGVAMGASASYHTWNRFPMTFRLGAGVLLGTAKDERSGTGHADARTTSGGTTIPAQDYPFSETQSPSARFLYFAPEVRVGYKLGERFELSVGVTALILRSLGDINWTDKSKLFVNNLGIVNFGSQAVVGSTLFVIVPGVGARYEF